MKRRIAFIIFLLTLSFQGAWSATDYADKVREEILPWVESVGQIFGLNQEALDSMQWEDGLTTTCPRLKYLQMKAIVDNPASYYCPSGYYRLRSSRGGYLYLEGTNPQTSTSKGEVASSIMHLQRAQDGGFYLQMQGLYLRTPLKDQTVTVSAVPEKFYPVVKTPGGKVAFTTNKGSYSALHCGYSAVIGYTLSDNASYWTVEPVTDFTVSATTSKDDKYYATLCVPFKSTAGVGTVAYTVTNSDSKAKAKAIQETIPAGTGVLLRGDEKSIAMHVADTDHSNVSGNQELRNDYADLSWKYFNKAFLLYSGQGKDNYTYYRTDLSTTTWLYYWQQALVILAVEDRYEFRGDKSCVSLITDLLDAFLVHEGTDWSWNNYNDDLLWAGLAFIRGYLITGQQRFLDQAVYGWNLMYNRGYDSTLGGGIWWSVDKEEKSGLSNNPAICMACYLYDATGDEAYLDKAKDLYTWVCNTLRKDDGAVAEKVDGDGTVSTSYNVYNIGTFIEGTAALYRITGDWSYATTCRKSIEYVMINKVTGKGILSNWETDGTWQSEFARGMAKYLQAYPKDWTHRGYYTTSKGSITYYKWMRLNADAAWETRDTVNNITGCKWETITPTQPSSSKVWESVACVSSVVMTNVTPQVQPGSDEEEYIDMDDNSEKYNQPVSDDEEEEASFVLDESGVMSVPRAKAGQYAVTYTDTLAQDNDLCGTYLSLVLTSGNATLNNGTNGLGFYPISSSATAKANTAYFPISTQLLLDLESLDDVPTAIENTPMTQKEVAYDLSGRRIKNPARGLYVTRGRKYIKK